MKISSEVPKMKKVELKTGLAPIPVSAAFLSISRGKMYAMVNSGECPSKRFGKSVRIPWAWLLQQAEVASDDSEVSR
jgi:excisionase family DNA binding protein